MSSISSNYSVATYALNVSAEQATSASQKFSNRVTDIIGADAPTDNSANFIEQLTYQANAKVLKADNLMVGSLMDVLDTPLRV